MEFDEIMFENRKFRIVLILLICLCFANCRDFHGNENEIFAIRSIVKIRELQKKYASKHSDKFAQNFDELVNEYDLNKDFGGEKTIINGYVFEMKVIEPTGENPAFFSIKANPNISERIKATGIRSFYFDSTLGTIKYSEQGEANAQSPSI